MDFVASCNNQNGAKPCPINFCHKCLLNRYREKAEAMSVLEDWSCPKCRGICNCNFCMKKRGHQPTGILVHTARATGFSSVSELLHLKGQEHSGSDKIVEAVSTVQTEAAASDNQPSAALPGKWGKENLFSGNTNSNPRSLPLPSNIDEKKQKKMKREGLKKTKDSNSDDVHVSKETQNSNQNHLPLLRKAITWKSHIAKEGSKNPQEGILLKENSNKSPQSTETLFKGKIDTDQTFGVLEDEKKLDTIVSGEIPSQLIGCRKNKERHDDKPQKCTEAVDNQKVDISLPKGAELTTVAGIELSPEDVGHALQFLEFCAAFQEILDLKKGEPECIIRELIRGGRATRGRYSLAVQFHIKLLSMIQEDLGEHSSVITPKNGKNSWLHVLQDCASQSQYILKELKLESFDWEGDYESLGLSEKLKILNFLCDEFLCTMKIRSWIDDQNSKFVQKVKEAREKVLAAKQKKKQLKFKMQDEIAKAIIAKNGAPLSISEHKSIVAQIKTEAAQSHDEILESEGMVPRGKQRSNALRTEPILMDMNGHIYWTLKGYSDKSDIMLQDVGTWDAVGSQEKWFTYDVEQEKEIKNYIFSDRCNRSRTSRNLNKNLTNRVSTKASKVDLVLQRLNLLNSAIKET